MKSTTRYPNRISLVLAGVMLTLLTVACGHSNPLILESTPKLVKIVQDANRSVAMIVTYDMDMNVSGIGSGFFIDDLGHLITNYHVLDGAFTAEIKTASGDKYPVESVIAVNQAGDLIKVRVRIPRENYEPLPVKKENPRIGEHILVVGSPLGFEQTVTDGIVSGIRDVPRIGKALQLTAPISPGSSGGPVIDMKGNVVGIISFALIQGQGQQNINFAVAAQGIENLSASDKPRTVSEWTYAHTQYSATQAEALCRTGFRFKISGGFKDAMLYYRENAEQQPEDDNAWYGLASCYDGLGQVDDAIEAYERPIRLDPSNIAARFLLAKYYQKLGRYQDALDSLTDVLLLNPDHVQAHYTRGTIFGELGMLELEERAYKDVIRISPNYAPAYQNIGMTYEKQGHYQKALKAFQDAVRVEPKDALGHYNMAVMYGHLEDQQMEMSAYQEAIRIDPDLVPAHFNLGAVYVKMGRKKDALSQYKILKGLNANVAALLFERIYPN